jgi:hypothetical protein
MSRARSAAAAARDAGAAQVARGAARFEGDPGAWLQRDASCLTQTDQGPAYVRDGDA